MSDGDIKDFVSNILNGELLDAREQFKDLLARRKREKEDELAVQADSEWQNVKATAFDDVDTEQL